MHSIVTISCIPYSITTFWNNIRNLTFVFSDGFNVYILNALTI